MNVTDELIPTRRSLLVRLKDWNDHESWRVFFDTYWKLIYGWALRSGLSNAEAQDVVQETIISVLKSMPSFKYDEVHGSFKSWLLRLTTWKITDQVRRRQLLIEDQVLPAASGGAEALGASVDPAIEQTWNEEWERNLVEAALERVKRKVDPKQYQAYDLCVFQKWPVSKVARSLDMNIGNVYLIKHRVGGQLKREIAHLRAKPI